MAEVNYYLYDNIEEITGYSMSLVNTVLMSYNILNFGHNPADLTTYQRKIISPRYRRESFPEYRKYFRERDVLIPEINSFRTIIEVTDAFLEKLPSMINLYLETQEKRQQEQDVINEENNKNMMKALAALRLKQEKEREAIKKREAEWDLAHGKKVNK